MGFPIHINWTSPFSILGLLDDIRQYGASDLDLHCLPMSHKKDARLILVNSLPPSVVC